MSTSVSWGFFGASFGDSLEKDIADDGDIGKVEDVPLQNGGTHGGDKESNGGGSQEKSVVVSESNGALPTERWSLIDDILRVYMDNTQDTHKVQTERERANL